MSSRWSRVCATSTASSAPSRARPAGTACRALRASPSPTSSRSTTTPTCSATCRVSACSTPGSTKRSAPTSAPPAGSAKTSVPRASPSAAGWRRRRRFWPAKAGGATLDARGSAGVCSREGVRPPAGGGWVNLRILFVEDSADDAELMLRRLREAGIEPHWDRVQTEAALREALVGERWDLALVDYNLPGFGGPQALAVLAAVATITAGAVDYVLKDNLTRLAPAVRRAVEGAELRRQRLRVREQARRTQFAIDHSSQAIVYVSEGGVILCLNAAAQRLGGVPPAEAVGQKIWSWLPLIDEKDSAALWADAVQHSPVQFETMMSTVAGQERPVAVTLEYPGRPSDAFVVVYARDLTEQRQAEERATESEALYRRIVEMAGEGILAMDGEYRTTFVNPQMAAMLGYETEEMLGRVVSDFIFDEDLDDYAAEMKGREAGKPGTYERRFRRKDGGEVWASVSSTADLGPDGEFLGSFGMFTDITEMRAAEEALRQSEEQFRRFAEYLPGRMTIKDAELRYVFGNDERAAELSLPSARWIGKTPEELWAPEEALAVRAIGERVLAGEVVDEVSESSSDHGMEYLHAVHFPIARGGETVLVGGISLDVTEQVEAQEEVRRQAQQLRRTVEGAVLAMSHVVETRDPYTAGHERRVAELATAIAGEMDMDGEELDALRHAGLIHDIGKIAVPAEILAKPGRLSEVEFNLIKQHPASGFDILEVIDFGRPVAEIVLQHHERLDGSGYPRGLAGADILPEARILAVADVVEAMSSHRPYRAALGVKAALAEIREHAGVKYDADVAAACVRLVEEQGFQFTP